MKTMAKVATLLVNYSPNSGLYDVGIPPSIITGKKWCLADPGGTSLYCIIASGDHPCLIMPSSSTHFFRVFRLQNCSNLVLYYVIALADV